MTAGKDTAADACPDCWGCGQVANTDDREPWKVWMDLPPQARLAVTMGFVRPMPCPTCNGSGRRRTEPKT